MSGQGQSIQDLLRRRLDLVAGMSALTATSHKLIQESAGAEMEMMRLQLELDRNPADNQLQSALNEVEDQIATIRSRHDGCIAEIEEAEAAVVEIDGLIAAAKGG
ncbi:MAG: hypothetical protein KGI75_22840 [Rhizobiaceae bacterium]|nr:hypothetical protein [Rhizobiaceae bacterium]